jgi:hypothetical protein
METTNEKICTPSQCRRYGRNLYSRIINLSQKTSINDIQKSIDNLVIQTKQLDSDKNVGYFEQVIRAWKTVASNDFRIKNYISEKYPTLLTEPATWLSENKIPRKNIPAKIASQPGLAREMSSVQRRELKNKWFSNAMDALGTLGSITELGNLSTADWDGTCAQLGQEVAHGLFGRKDIEGVGLWDKFKDLLRKEESDTPDEIEKAKRKAQESQPTYTKDRGKDVVVEGATSKGGRSPITVFRPETTTSDDEDVN